MEPYYNWPCFKDVYLEDSYVLNISEKEDSFEIEIEAVLREGHAEYKDPIDGEQYCYKKGVIRFSNPSSVTWKRRSNSKSFDDDRSFDLGNIDIFVRDGDVYHLSGDWGEVLISSDSCNLETVF